MSRLRPPRRRQGSSSCRDRRYPGHFPPTWRKATGDLLRAYDRVCAYACLYIERITGAATVDHWAPRSKRWDQVYEWENYRLACSLMNSRKSVYDDVVDPFDVSDGMFALDLVTLKAIPGPEAGENRAEVLATIQRLGLDSIDYSEALADYYHDYLEGHIGLHRLESRAPFLAREMRRQGKLLPGDV